MVEEIDIDKIKLSNFNVRKGATNIMDLVESIKSVGVLQAILVKKIDDNYEVVAGRRRFLAAKEAKLKTVPATILNISNNKDAIQISLIENIHQESMDPVDRANAEKELLEIYKREGKDLDDLSKKLGRAKKSIQEDLALLDLDREARKHVSRGEINLTVAARISQLSSNRQNEVMDVIVERNLPRRESLKLVQRARESSDKSANQIVNEILSEQEFIVKITFPGNVYRALEKACERTRTNSDKVINDALKAYLKQRGFLDGS